MTQMVARAGGGTYSRTRYLLALGIVSRETEFDRRQRLRTLYQGSSVDVLVRFVLDASWLASQNVSVLQGDEVGVSGGNLALKAFGWWREAARWTASFYAKTDDDAVIDIGPLRLLLLAMPPAQPVFAGVVRYTHLNASTLMGACWGLGAGAAVKLHRAACAGSGYLGPLPFVEGPLEVLSAELWRFVTISLSRGRVADALALGRRSARYALEVLAYVEDRLLGYVVSQLDSVVLVNLAHTVRNMNVVDIHDEWAGADSFVAHHVRTREHFELAVADFGRSSRQRREHHCAAGRVRNNAVARFRCRKRRPVPAFNHSAPLLSCADWSSEFPPLLEHFACCHGWTSCKGPAADELWSRSQRTFNFNSY